MKRALCLGIALAALTAAGRAQVAAPGPGPAPGRAGAAEARRTLDTYCVGCHNAKAKAGGLALDSLPLDGGRVAEHADVWEKTVRKLRGRLMPPPTARQPNQTEI